MTAAAAGVVLVVAGVVCIPILQAYLRESEFIETLKSGSMAEKKLAANRLAEMKSVRSIPALLQLVEEFDTASFLIDALHEIGTGGVSRLLAALEFKNTLPER